MKTQFYIFISLSIICSLANAEGPFFSKEESGLRQSRIRQRQFPQIRENSKTIYFDEFAHLFEKARVEKLRQTKPQVLIQGKRFRLYLADSLGLSIWSHGGGFFTIHAGLLSSSISKNAFHFLLALELAHDALDHAAVDQYPLEAPVTLPIAVPFIGAGQVPSTLVLDQFALLSKSNPIIEQNFSYTWREESDALELVSALFDLQKWDLKKASQELIDFFSTERVEKGDRSLALLHRELALALKHPFPKKLSFTSHALSPQSSRIESDYDHLREAVIRSPLQRNPWLIHAIPFMSLLTKEGSDLESDLLDFDKIRSQNNVANSDGKWAETWVLNKLYLNHGATNQVSVPKGGELNDLFLFQQGTAAVLNTLLHPHTPNDCRAHLKNEWSQWDFRRRILLIQCHLARGELSKGLEIARRLEDSATSDPLGRVASFWKTLILIRLREAEANASLNQLENIWGERPYTSALRIFSEVRRGVTKTLDVSLKTAPEDTAYSSEERGIFRFAQAWASAQLGRSDYRAYEKQSAVLWPQGRNAWPLFPLEIER